jgi:ribosomal-protein-alanine N-acetyltransferase
MKVHQRWMIRRDMQQVLDIESRCFEFPWTDEDFARVIRQRNVIGMVAERADWDVIGFVVYELHHTRLHILNLAVDYEYRRQDVGSQMLDKLVGKLSTQRRTRITLEVRETNLPALLFFKACGFEAVSLMRGYYEDTDEDAILMQRKCPELQEAEA